MLILCLFASITIASVSALGSLISGATLIEAFKIYSITGTITFLMTPITFRCAASITAFLHNIQDAHDMASADRS